MPQVASVWSRPTDGTACQDLGSLSHELEPQSKAHEPECGTWGENGICRLHRGLGCGSQCVEEGASGFLSLVYLLMFEKSQRQA